jgi:hypothetical protein
LLTLQSRIGSESIVPSVPGDTPAPYAKEIPFLARLGPGFDLSGNSRRLLADAIFDSLAEQSQSFGTYTAMPWPQMH